MTCPHYRWFSVLFIAMASQAYAAGASAPAAPSGASAVKSTNSRGKTALQSARGIVQGTQSTRAGNNPLHRTTPAVSGPNSAAPTAVERKGPAETVFNTGDFTNY